MEGVGIYSPVNLKLSTMAQTMKSVLQERVTKRIEKGQAIAVKILDRMEM